MASRAHRWPGDNTPLTGVHGGSAAGARAAVAEAKRIQWEWAKQCAERVLARDQATAQAARQGRVRPRVAIGRQRVLSDIVWDACKGLCAYCGGQMMRFGDDPIAFSLDHVIPKSRGGSNALANLAGAHKRCNNEKGSLTGEEYQLVLAQRGNRSPVV